VEAQLDLKLLFIPLGCLDHQKFLIVFIQGTVLITIHLFPQRDYSIVFVEELNFISKVLDFSIETLSKYYSIERLLF
jgi:hypothetical protein